MPMLEKLSRCHLTGLITLVLLMWKWIGLLLKKNYPFKMLGLTFSSKLNWKLSLSYVISSAKFTSKKIGDLIRSMKFLSPEFALNRYRSTIQPCMEYCCHVWAGAPTCYLQLLNKLRKRVGRNVGSLLAASLNSSKCSQLKSFL